MLSRAVRENAQDYRVMLVSGGAVAAEEVVRFCVEAQAFARATEMAARVANQDGDDVSVYVLDNDNVFIGSVAAQSAPAPLAA